MKIFKWLVKPEVKNFMLLMVFILLTTQSAFADLVSDMSDLQGKITTICNPLAIIFLIVAGWQKAMGNAQLFILALVGTVVMFAAPQIVNFISASFGN